jgi:malyl-CoA/(S)-citramalyl-CoA lyase
MKLPARFYRPLAVGAPAPWRELPVTLERMIHFFPPHIEKMRAKVPDMIGDVDVLLGNLEDAIPADAKAAARDGFIEAASANDFADTGLWVRINSLNSPWALDDIIEIVAAVGDKLDVMMLPKVEGPWDIHYLDQLLAQLEARHEVPKPILIHAILETAEGVNNVEAIAAASPRLHGMSLGPADLAASRGMKTTRVGGGHPGLRRAGRREPGGAAPFSSRTCGTTPSPRWSMPASPTPSSRSTARSATSAMRKLARRSSATPSCKAASAPGRCTPARSPSPSGCSAPSRTRCALRCASSRRCPTAPARR